METVLSIAGVIAAWYLLSRFVLPRLGIRS